MGGTDTGPVGKITITSDDYKTKLGYYELIKEIGKNKYSASVAEKYDVSGADQGKRFLKFAQPSDTAYAQNLQEEAAFRMYHPFIEHIYVFHHAVDEEGTQWVVLEAEYVSKTTLHDFFAQPRTDDEKFCCMMQLVEAVHYYVEYRQRNPYVHRDLKPKNIMIESKNGKFFRCVIVDFDSAHIPIGDDPEETRHIIDCLFYSPGYTPIEIPDQKQRTLSDIYSLGRIFCYILKGTEYFTEAEHDEQEKALWLLICNSKQSTAVENPCWFGLQSEQLGEKYKNETYKGLLSIIDKMTATQDKRYKNIGGSASTNGGVLYDLKQFFRSYYGEKYDDFLSKVFVETEEAAFLMEKDMGCPYTIFPYLENGEPLSQVKLKNYDVGEIYDEKKTILTLYRIGETIYYVPYDSQISWEKDTGFELTEDSGLSYGETKITFQKQSYS